MLNIDSIENGIVIDHITAGLGMRIYELLELDKLDTCVAIIKNAKSEKYGKKDIIKIEGVNFIFISPEELRVPSYILKEVVIPSGHPWKEVRIMEEVMPELDILYMTRVQRERFFNEEDYVRLKDSYVLTQQKLDLGKADLAVLHPLPRVNEIAPEVDSDPRAMYFEQARGGVFVRMALILSLLGLAPGVLDHE